MFLTVKNITFTTEGAIKQTPSTNLKLIDNESLIDKFVKSLNRDSKTITIIDGLSSLISNR